MEVKGTAVIPIQYFVIQQNGEEGYNRWISELSPYARQLFSTKISPDEWFPLKEMFLEPMKLMCDMFHDGSTEGAWNCGRYSAEMAANRFMKMFVRVASIQTLLRKASLILPKYYKPCFMSLDEMKINSAVVSITKFRDIDAYVEARIGGWIERAVEISGCEDVNVEIVKSLFDGDKTTSYQINWTRQVLFKRRVKTLQKETA
jgi:hypothetical protein